MKSSQSYLLDKVKNLVLESDPRYINYVVDVHPVLKKKTSSFQLKLTGIPATRRARPHARMFLAALISR